MKKFLLILFIIPFLARGQVIDLNNTDTVTDYSSLAIIDLDKVYELYNDSADVLFTYWTDEDATLKAATSQFYDTIQEYHIDDSLDFLYNFAVNTTGNAIYDWIRIGTTATLVNSPTFTAYQGYTTDGASSYVKANYNPGTDAVHYRLNSASIGVYIRTNDLTDARDLIGISDGTNYSLILVRTSILTNAINTAAAGLYHYSHGSDISGFTIHTRADASNLKQARNSATYSSGSGAVNAISNHVNGFYIGARNFNGSATQYSNNQFSFAFGGGQLTETQKTKLYEAMERYMDFFGYGVND